MAVLVNLLSAAGAVIGRGPHIMVGNDRHPTLIWALTIGPTSSGRKGSATSTARRVLADCAAPAPPPAVCSARLDFGFIASLGTHATFTRTALSAPIRWEATANGFAYRLQKREDAPPPGAGAFPITNIGAVNLYRLR